MNTHPQDAKFYLNLLSGLASEKRTDKQSYFPIYILVWIVYFLLTNNLLCYDVYLNKIDI